ncbi:MAG: hypothetical protein E7620_04300 [Ruminococcaceae bacterium]|nr:hypothetical protein [Oscillospiraceae bacterium]
MKRFLSVLMILAICFSCMAILPAAEENAEKIVYLSDSGADTNDGLTKETPVLTMAKAAELLGGATAEGTIMVVGTYTYPSNGSWVTPTAKHLTVKGADENAVFYQARGNLNLKSDLTFTAIQYKSSGTIAANGFTLTVAEDVKVIPVDATKPEDRAQYPVVTAGPSGNTTTAESKVYLYAGTYNYVYAAGYTASGASLFHVGEKATVLHNFHICNPNANASGDVTIEVMGTLNGQLTFNTGAKLGGNVNVVFGKTAVWEKGVTDLTPKFNTYHTTDKKSIDLSEAKTLFAEGKTLIVDATANKTISDMLGYVTEAGFTVKTWVDTSLSTVYISDNGNDANDGKTAETPVQTYQRAQELLGETGGTIMITDIYTYPSTSYYMPYVKGASYVIKGMKEDGSSIFAHGRKNIAMTNPLTFDNLTYKLAVSTWSSLQAFFNRLEFTESVTMVPYNNVDERINYLFVYGGSEGKLGTAEQHVNLVINGGTFGYIVSGCKNQEMYGNVNVTFGGKAKIIQRLYCGGESGINDIYGEININITGGEIGDMIYAGGTGDTTFVSGNTTITITGGTFKDIYCRGTGTGVHLGNIVIDVTNYAPAQEEGWIDDHIKDRTDKTTILGGKARPVQPEEPTQEPTKEPDAPTQEPTKEPDTPTQEPTVELPTETPGTEAPTPGTNGDSNIITVGGGCKGSASVIGVATILLIGSAACVVRKKEK